MLEPFELEVNYLNQKIVLLTRKIDRVALIVVVFRTKYFRRLHDLGAIVVLLDRFLNLAVCTSLLDLGLVDTESELVHYFWCVVVDHYKMPIHLLGLFVESSEYDWPFWTIIVGYHHLFHVDVEVFEFVFVF